MNGCRRVERYFVYRLMKVSECSGIQLILDWMDNWLLLNEGHQKKEEVLLLLHVSNILFILPKVLLRILLVLNGSRFY